MLLSRTRFLLAGAPALLALALFTVAAGAGPWVQSKNGYFTTARLGLLSTSKYYDVDGNEVDASATLAYKDRTVQFDTEYGISNRMTFLLGMPVRFLSLDLTSGDPSSFNNNGFGDLNFGLKYGFLNPAGKTALALELDANTPTGYNANGAGIPPMGRGKFSAYGRLHAGTTFDPTRVYVQTEVGYRLFTADSTYYTTNPPDTLKTAQVSNSIIFGLEAGFFATPRILIVGEYRMEQSLDSLSQFQDLTQIAGTVQYRLKPHVDVLAGVRTSLSGKNVAKGTEIRLGVSLKGNALGPYRGQTSAGYAEGAFPGVPAAKSAAPAPVPVPAPATPAPADSASAPATPK
jgi:hypothetical protein